MYCSNSIIFLLSLHEEHYLRLSSVIYISPTGHCIDQLTAHSTIILIFVHLISVS